MTACTNNGGKARRVVTAALVGVLSVGAVPAIALATGNDVSLMADEAASLAGADIVYKKGQPGDVYYANGNKQGLVPFEIDPDVAGIDNIEVTSVPSKPVVGAYYYFYVNLGSTTGNQFTAVNGSAVVKYDAGDKGMVQVKGEWSFDMPSDAGTYAVVVGRWNGSNNWDFVDVADTFTIASYSLADATLIDDDDVTDTTFDWTGESGKADTAAWWGRLNVAVDGHILTKSTDDGRTGDYILQLRNKGGQGAVSGDLKPGTTYAAVITGVNGYAGQSKQVEFTIAKLNLTDAVITPVVTDTDTPDAESTLAEVAADINGVSNYGGYLKDNVEVVFEKDPDGNPTSSGEEGKYTFTIKATKDSEWVEGEQTVTVVKADRLANINFAACGTPDGEDYVVDLGAEKPVYFDLNRVKVTDPNGGDVDYTFEIKDDEGKTYADDSALRNPGTYYVTVNAWEYVNGELVAQSKTVKVVVSYDNVTEQNNIFFVFDGKNYAESDTAPAEYDGTDLSEKVSVTVKVGDKTLVEGTDYDVTIERSDADGGWTKVDSIVDAGDYVITVTGKTFSETAKFSLHVDPMELDAKAAVNGGVATDETTYLAYTGDVLTPTFSFYKDGAEVEVPADAFEVTYDAIGTNNGLPNPSAPIDTDVELKAKGAYKATFSATEAGANYDFDGVDVTFLVSDKKVFLDVPSQRVVQPGGLHRPRQRLHERRRLGQDLLPDARAHPRRGGLRAVQHGRRRRVLQERDHRRVRPRRQGLRDRLLRRRRQRVLRQGDRLGRADRRHQPATPTAPRRLPQGDQRGVRLPCWRTTPRPRARTSPSLTPTRSSRATPTPPSSPTGPRAASPGPSPRASWATVRPSPRPAPSCACARRPWS